MVKKVSARLCSMPEQRSAILYLSSFKSACEDLSRIEFPALIRPNVAENSSPTPDLLNWAIRMYCFSLISHLRELLRSFVLLAENSNIPAACIIARCLFEVGAHAYYVHKDVNQYSKAKDYSSAWDFMHEVNMGSLYMQEEQAEIGKEGDAWQLPKPREIAKVIRCFDEYGNIRKAVKTYSFLSEFSHPNMAAFSHYYQIGRNEQGMVQVRFHHPLQSPEEAPFPDSLNLTRCGTPIHGKTLARGR